LRKAPSTSLGIMKDNKVKVGDSFINNKSIVGDKSMSLHQIMLQKGSKCKCVNDGDIFTKNESEV
jgi:hypothetical protein